jgi:flavin-dependent dehydrogenase
VLLHCLEAKGITTTNDTVLEKVEHQVPVGRFAVDPPVTAPVYVVGDAGGAPLRYMERASSIRSFLALKSGRFAALTAAAYASACAHFRRYYRRLWQTVLPNILLSHYLSQYFYEDIGVSRHVLESRCV